MAPATAVTDAHDALVVVQPLGRQNRDIVASQDNARIRHETTGVNICDVQMGAVPRHIGVAPSEEAEAAAVGRQARVGIEVGGRNGYERAEVPGGRHGNQVTRNAVVLGVHLPNAPELIAWACDDFSKAPASGGWWGGGDGNGGQP